MTNQLSDHSSLIHICIVWFRTRFLWYSSLQSVCCSGEHVVIDTLIVIFFSTGIDSKNYNHFCPAYDDSLKQRDIGSTIPVMSEADPPIVPDKEFLGGVLNATKYDGGVSGEKPGVL